MECLSVYLQQKERTEKLDQNHLLFVLPCDFVFFFFFSLESIVFQNFIFRKYLRVLYNNKKTRKNSERLSEFSLGFYCELFKTDCCFSGFTHSVRDIEYSRMHFFFIRNLARPLVPKVSWISSILISNSFLSSFSICNLLFSLYISIFYFYSKTKLMICQKNIFSTLWKRYLK